MTVHSLASALRPVGNLSSYDVFAYRDDLYRVDGEVAGGVAVHKLSFGKGGRLVQLLDDPTVFDYDQIVEERKQNGTPLELFGFNLAPSVSVTVAAADEEDARLRMIACETIFAEVVNATEAYKLSGSALRG